MHARGELELVVMSAPAGRQKQSLFIVLPNRPPYLRVALYGVITGLGHQSPSALRSRSLGVLKTLSLGAPGCWLDGKEMN